MMKKRVVVDGDLRYQLVKMIKNLTLRKKILKAIIKVMLMKKKR